ncbi:MAG: ATP-binding protein [Actinomycetota bacterium]|nr:ATP-binding protein [Actinomycetota bacterium]
MRTARRDISRPEDKGRGRRQDSANSALPEVLTRQGLTLPRHVTTTRHLAAIYPFAVEAGLGVRGVFMGVNRLSGGGGFYFDLFEALNAKMITAPNMAITGSGGFGKSGLSKTYVWRSSILADAHRRGRFISILDPKGEWVRLGQRMGLVVVDLKPGGDVRINPLDPGPTGSNLSPEDLARKQTPVICALFAVVLRRKLHVGEDRVVGYALQMVSRGRLTRPTLADVRTVLAHPTEQMAAELDTNLDELRGRCRDLLDACALLLDGELKGMFDGPTTVDLDWDTCPGIVVNLSSVLDNPTALELVMIAGAGWLQALMHGHKDRLKLNIIDEAYKAIANPAMVSYLQDAWKVGRQFGTGNILIIHALSELRAQFDDGVAAVKQAEALLNTTSVKVFLHQNHDQVGDLLARCGLTPAEAERLPTMPAHQALWKVGDYTALTNQVLHGEEYWFCDTNATMRGDG